MPEGVVVNKHRPKYNFTVRALTRVQVTLWTKDDLMFIPERYRIQTTFIINVFCWTGARLSAFFTTVKPGYKNIGYKNILDIFLSFKVISKFWLYN